MENNDYAHMEFNSGPSYLWWRKERILDIFDVGEELLELWVKNNTIRFAEANDRRLYSAGDIDVLLKWISSINTNKNS